MDPNQNFPPNSVPPAPSTDPTNNPDSSIPTSNPSSTLSTPMDGVTPGLTQTPISPLPPVAESGQPPPANPIPPFLPNQSAPTPPGLPMDGQPTITPPSLGEPIPTSIDPNLASPPIAAGGTATPDGFAPTSPWTQNAAQIPTAPGDNTLSAPMEPTPGVTLPPNQNLGTVPNAASSDQATDLYGTIGAIPAQPASPPEIPLSDTPKPEMSEPAPTDLSQLSGINETPSYTPPVSNPETLVAPQPSTIPESAPEQAAHKLPKALLIGGILVVLLIAAASIYFFFFSNKSAPATSIPAQEQTPLTNPPKSQTPPSAATQSAGFNTLNPNPPAASAASSANTTSGQSAIDLLRQRQAASTSATTSTAP